MKKAVFSRNLSILLLVLILFACRKSALTSPEPTSDEQIAGPPPPTVCEYPNVSVSNYAGNGGTGNINAKLLASELSHPSAITQSTSGAVIYVSTGNTIRKLYGADVTTLITLDEAIACLATDRDGNIYAGGETTIKKISPAGVLLTTHGRLGEPGSSNAPILRFHGVRGLAIDNAGNIYVGEWANRIIRKIQPDGTATRFAGRPGALYFGVPLADGPALEAQFSYLGGIAINASGTRLYVADEFCIRMIEAGYVYTIAGSGVESARGIVDGNATSARFNELSGIAIDAAENLYVFDKTNEHPAVWLSRSMLRKVRKMTSGPVARKVTTLAGGTIGYVNGVGTAAKFNRPTGLLINAAATTAYVADTDNNRVRKLLFSCPSVF